MRGDVMGDDVMRGDVIRICHGRDVMRGLSS